MALPEGSNVDQTWDFIKAGIDKILVEDITKGVDRETYMNIYTAIHNFCVSHHSSVTGRFGGIAGSHSPSGGGVSRGAQLLGADLYRRLEEYLKRHMENLRDHGINFSGETLINYYNEIWHRYTVGAKYLNHIFDYVNRHWVKREREEGKRDVYDVSTLCLVRWRDDLFEDIKERLVEAILKQIEKQRNGEAIVHHNIKQVIQSFVSLGLDDGASQKRENLSVYQKDFQSKFINATKAYYQAESDKFLADHSVVEYIQKANDRLKEEAGRVQLYLHASTDADLMKTCDDILITNHADVIQNEFHTLLTEDRQHDFHLLYLLLARVPGLLEPVQNTLKEYVTKQGLAAVVRLKKETEGTVDPKNYILTLLEVQEKYSRIVKEAFDNNTGMVQAMDDGCKAFINTNVIAEEGKGRDSRTPELLARYSDQLLKKSSKGNEETDIDAAMNGIMTVFQYVESKDSFEKFYKRMLSRRLVHQNSTSEDAETSMVAKLKQACGYEYTNGLQRMFQDMHTSQEMENEFKQTINKDEGLIDFTPRILAENFWPLPDFKMQYRMPKDLNPIYERFTGFFNNKHSGRKLKWLWNFSKGEIKTNFTTTSKVGYTLSVSAYQLAIIMPFNEADSYPVEQLKEIAGLPDDVFEGSIGILLKARLLTQEPTGVPIGQAGNVFKLNFGFKNKKVRVKLDLPLKMEQKQEVEQTQKTIDEDRKMFLQAVIVRVMKARKELRSVQLIQETIDLSKKRFQPKIQEIKKSIDLLVDKEYLERLDDNKLRYLA